MVHAWLPTLPKDPSRLGTVGAWGIRAIGFVICSASGDSSDVIPQPTLTSPTTVGQSSGDHGGENGTTQTVPTDQQMHVVQKQQMHVTQEQEQVLSSGQQVLADQHVSVVQDQQVHVAQEQVMNSDQNEQILSVDLHPTDGAESDVDGSAAGQPDNSETRRSVPLHLSNVAHSIEMGDGADSQGACKRPGRGERAKSSGSDLTLSFQKKLNV
ncbi:hypothetical protein V6N13_090134 [Hibiscus sabdariffa]